MKPYYGLIVLSSLNKMKTGSNRSIRLVQTPLQKLNVHLQYISVRTVLHFIPSFIRGKRLRYDFVIFNGVASISSKSLFGYWLWRITQIFNIPTFIYWHETDWVLDRLVKKSKDQHRITKITSNYRTCNLTASDACSQSIAKYFRADKPTAIFECAEIPSPFNLPVHPTHPPTVVNIASIQERKGTDLFVETAIKVCSQNPDVEFIWLGYGKPFGTWQNEIRNAGLEHRILFPGYVDAAHLILRRASVFFLSSRDDPFPLSLLEAMSLGRTIVAFNVGGVAEALDGQGFMIPPFDTELAVNAILECLEKPPEELFNSRVRERYLNKYTPQKFAERLELVLQENLSLSERVTRE